jgi:hypothetical protein
VVLDVKQKSLYTELVKRFNVWFDALHEPSRLYWFIALVAPALAGLASDHFGFALAWFAGLLILRRGPF